MKVAAARRDMSPTSDKGLPAKHKNPSKTSLDSHGVCVNTLGEDCGLGKILLGIKYQTTNSVLEVRVVKADGLRSLRAVTEPDAPKPSTHCTVAFLPDQTKPVSTETVEGSLSPHWQGVFRFEKFPCLSLNQKCLQVQVIDSATGTAMSEVTVLLGNWSQEDFQKGVKLWKYLNGTQESQRVSTKAGNAFLTLQCKSDRMKMVVHRIEDLHTRLVGPTETKVFYIKLQALQSGRLIKEATLKGLRGPVGNDVNFYDGKFSVNVGKRSHGFRCLSLRLLVTRQLDCIEQQLYWLDLGAEVKRPDCRNLYESVLENSHQCHVVSVMLNKPPVMPPWE